MDFRKLNHLVVLARHLNFTQAARALNITQPALSRSIRALEAESQIRLFERNNGSVVLTNAGREVVGHAERMLQHHAKMRGVVSDIAHGKGGRIAIGMTPVAARILLEPLLRPHLVQPNFHASVVIEGERKLLKMMLEDSLDISVCSDPDIVAHGSLTVTQLTRLSLAMLVRKGHPLTFHERLQPSVIAHYPLIRSRPFEGDEDGPIIVGPSQSRPPAVTVEDYEVLTRLALNSDAIWVTTPLASQDEIARGDLVELPISWLPQAPTTVLTAYSPAGRVASPLVKTMLDQLAAISAELPAATADAPGSRL